MRRTAKTKQYYPTWLLRQSQQYLAHRFRQNTMCCKVNLASYKMNYQERQAKLGILEKESIQPSEFSSILFGTTPLFTESLDELVQEKQQLVEKINAHKRFVTEQIRTVEIESENIQSIGLGHGSDNYADKLNSIKKSQPPVTHVSQRNVERLIKD
jgi:hypothetical protein